MNKRIRKKNFTPGKRTMKKLKMLNRGEKKAISVTKLQLNAVMRYKERTHLRKRSYVLRVSSSTGKLFLVKQEPRLRLDKADNFGTRAAHTVRL